MSKYFRLPRKSTGEIRLKGILWSVFITWVILIGIVNLLLVTIFEQTTGQSLIYIRSITFISISLIALVIGAALYSFEKMMVSIREITGGLEHLYERDLPHSEKHRGPTELINLISSMNSNAVDVRSNFSDLSNERDTLSSLLETMTDGVILVEDGKIEIMNNSAYEILGITEIPAESNSFMNIIRDHEMNSILEETIETSARVESDISFNQTNKIVHVTSSPGTQGNEKKVLLTLHDLTESRHMDQTRREFVSNVSHELRTPLASIKAMVESLENGAIKDEKYASDFLHRIHSTVDSMNDIVSDLLILSKAESDDKNITTEKVDIKRAAEFASRALSEKAKGKSVAISITSKGPLALVKANETQIEIVFTNLIDNAIKFSDKNGKVAIEIDSKDNVVVTSVKDNGIGIDREHLDRIFERFYKAERSRHNEGTGLGLSIVRHVIESYGGSIAVESNLGEGASFSFTLPTLD
ncbi:MAG: sensor histidine kinase [Dehalococcoidia bacterium]